LAGDAILFQRFQQQTLQPNLAQDFRTVLLLDLAIFQASVHRPLDLGQLCFL
jgi:hypothetical protein